MKRNIANGNPYTMGWGRGMKCPSCGCTRSDTYEMNDIERGVEVKVVITYSTECQTTLKREVYTISHN